MKRIIVALATIVAIGWLASQTVHAQPNVRGNSQAVKAAQAKPPKPVSGGAVKPASGLGPQGSKPKAQSPKPAKPTGGQSAKSKPGKPPAPAGSSSTPASSKTAASKNENSSKSKAADSGQNKKAAAMTVESGAAAAADSSETDGRSRKKEKGDPADTGSTESGSSDNRTSDNGTAPDGVDSTSGAGDTVETTQVRSRAAVQLEKNPALAERLANTFPPGTDLVEMADGFKNLGQFVSAVQVSSNLGIAFDDLKAMMVGDLNTMTAGDGSVSLGQAIQALKSDVDATAEAALAQKQAKAEIAAAEADQKTSKKVKILHFIPDP